MPGMAEWIVTGARTGSCTMLRTTVTAADAWSASLAAETAHPGFRALTARRVRPWRPAVR